MSALVSISFLIIQALCFFLFLFFYFLFFLLFFFYERKTKRLLEQSNQQMQNRKSDKFYAILLKSYPHQSSYIIIYIHFCYSNYVYLRDYFTFIFYFFNIFLSSPLSITNTLYFYYIYRLDRSINIKSQLLLYIYFLSLSR